MNRIFCNQLTGVLLTLLIVVTQAVWAGDETELYQGKVNKKLWELSQGYSTPKLIPLGSRVHAAYSYDHANYGFIEGDDGIILVDSGWWPGLVKKSLEDYRKLTDKPIVAVIYTHIHLDHTMGLPAMLGDTTGEVPVFAPSGWQQWMEESTSATRPMLMKRVYAQLGMLLPPGPDGTVGTGDGKTPVPSGTPGFIPPTVEVAEETSLTISGVRIQLIPAQGDLNETLFVWLPDERVLFAGDILAGTFPYIETVRMELERDPRNFIKSFNKALALAPEYLVAGHGRILIGADDVRENLTANRDVTEFMVDQLDRLYTKGYTADQIIDELRLPPALAANPDLQLHYHRLEWMIRTMFLKRGGFFGDIMDISSLTKSEESKRLVPLMGGELKVVEAAREALAAGDPRWAARLASYVLTVNADNKQAFELRLQAYRQIAIHTESANERNYLLTEIKSERGEIDWGRMLSASNYNAMKEAKVEQVLAILKARFRAEEANDLSFAVEVKVSDLAAPRYLIVNNNVLRITLVPENTPDASIYMERDVLNQIVAGVVSFSGALENKEIMVSSGQKNARLLASLIE